MTTFDEATAAHRVGDGRYELRLSPDYTIGHALNGGYLMAALLRAVLDDSPHPHPVATSVHFLRVAACAPAEVHIERLKAGRTAATARATLVQDEVPVLDALVSTGTIAQSAEPTWVAPPPPLPPVEQCLAFAPKVRHGEPTALSRQIDVRFDPATMGWVDGRPSGALEMRGYFRLREPHDPDPCVLALAVDVLPPAVFGIGALGWAPTVELTWHMRAVPAPGWLRVHVRGRLVHDGWFDEEAEIWDAAGRLVAQSRQIARVGR